MSGSDRSSHATGALRLLHYWWPVAIGWSLAVVESTACGRPVSSPGLAVLLCGICGAYSLDRIAEHPQSGLYPEPRLTPLHSRAGSLRSARGPAVRAVRRSGHEEPRWLRAVLVVAFFVSGTACLALVRRLPAGTAAIVPVLVLIGLAYRRIKHHPLTKTVLVPAVWTWAGIALPAADGSWLGWHSVFRPVSAPLIALVAAGCLLCDIKDADADRRSGIGSLPATCGVPWTTAIATALAAVAASLALIQHRDGLIAAAAALAGLAQWTSLLSGGPAGALLVDVALTLPGLLIFVHLT